MSDLLSSPYIISIAAAWLIAHTVKFVARYIKTGKINSLATLFESGGMPSSHSATSVALCVVIGLINGLGSGLFGLAALLTIIVMYDAMNVRRSSGEQGTALVDIIKDHKKDAKLPRVVMGHTPLEVAAGACLGLLIGVVVFFATR